MHEALRVIAGITFKPVRSRLLGLVCLLTILFAATASAHFLLNLNVRIFHVEHVQDGLRVYLRTPMPYLVADKVGDDVGENLPAPAPFTTNAREDGQLVHYIDTVQIASDPLGLGRLASDGLTISRDGVRLIGEVTDVQLHRVGEEPGFATLDEAREAFAPTDVAPEASIPVYVGDVIVDVLIRYPTEAPVSAYALSSTLNPGLPGQETTANVILDYGPGNPQIFRSRGLLNEPVTISRSQIAAFTTFIYEGMVHILEGIDHVLFVICLILGARGLHSLLWRVTGFTIGHSVTLALGFFGYVPSGAWFIPAVETGIALSIIYAAAIALWPHQSMQHSTVPRMFFVTVAIGLLHGLGFSFVLQEILQIDAPNIWQSLVAFNVGVELGQLLIVLFVYPAVVFLPRFSQKSWNYTRTALGAGCICIAGFWTAERALQLANSIL